MTYDAIKKMIESGRYAKEDLMQKLDIFLLANRITQEQYNQLTALIA